MYLIADYAMLHLQQKGVIMLTTEYLRTILYDIKTISGESVNVGLPSVTSPDQIIESPDGFQGFEVLAQHKDLPFAILFEDAFHYDDNDSYDVPCTMYRQSIYVVRMAPGDAPSKPIEDQCFADVQRIRKVLLHHVHDAQLSGWERRSSRDYVAGASNYVGWKLSLPFVENEDLYLG